MIHHFHNKNGLTSSLLFLGKVSVSLHMCDAQGPWNPDQITEYRLNFSVLFGVMRQKLYQVLIGNCSPKSFQALFNRASIRAKVKVRPGRLYSRNKVDKPKRHHVFRRVC